MAFGSFRVEERDVRPVEQKTRKEKGAAAKPFSADSSGAGAGRLHILLIGRNLPIMQEFLCSMSQNAGEALGGQGFAFYTQELETITCVTTFKKKLEQYCWSFTEADWIYPPDQENEDTYVFSISPSGTPSKALDLVIHCITPNSEKKVHWEQTDAIWLLSDGALFYHSEDPFLCDLQDILAQLPQQLGETQKPVCLIQTQIEQVAHFDGVGTRSDLPRKQAEQIYALCRAQFAAEVPVALIPVQVYGGMECIGMDEKHAPVLHLGRSGFYQFYSPDHCQMPGLYTIQAICANRQTDYFADLPEGSLMQGIYKHYSSKLGTPQWQPEWLCSKEEL